MTKIGDRVRIISPDKRVMFTEVTHIGLVSDGWCMVTVRTPLLEKFYYSVPEAQVQR